ncbi:hypothetical protein HK105_202992 [Polyrhizophydium stewartii]|uniref:Intraflagellar transport protein 122 homolog n=1 Tax=Polyrhizophydium stewartii TaxID=2732419 RepID=A0ABR4NCS9_9FUNG
MRPFPTWSDKVQDAAGVPQPIYDVIFTLDGAQLVAGAGVEVLVYDASSGELLKALKAHRDAVLALCPLKGNGFASGAADKQVIIWSNKWEGTLKYSHNDTIQSLSQNPVTGLVLSCTASDFGLWAPDVKAVNKTKVPSRILCSSWTPDGQHFALGMYNGHISIRSRTGEEKVRIERGTSPVWSLAWSPAPDLELDVLAVADWSQKLSFFQINGRQVGKDRQLGFDPCSVSYFSSGEYLILGGSDRKVHLWTPDGIRIAPICERDGWIWSCRVRPKQNFIAVGSNDGTISVHQIVFNTVHGLYVDRYAFRQNMTDVVIQHLITDQRARIKCRDYVKKISVYKDRLAVQLPDRIIIYELFHDDAGDMHYRIKEKLQKNLECNLLVVTSQNIILCLERKLQMFSFIGEKEHEWVLDSLIRYIKVVGGPRGREGLLVGLKDGQVLKIFVDSPFPIPVIRQQAAIRCLDLNLSRTKLAIVDDQNMCLVYSVKTQELLYQEPNANSAAWNTEIDDMLCFSGNGILNVKVGNFPAHQQKMTGFVVGFKGPRIFCLNVYTMTTIDIPQTPALDRYMEKDDFLAAYQAACLGVPEADWRRLALEALERLHLDVAKKAFIRIRDFRFLEVIRAVEKLRIEGRRDNDLFLAQVTAYAGKYHEAARLFKRSGHIQRAIEMYTELNLWEYATQLAEETDGKTDDILKRKAQMQEDRKDMLAAAATYEQVGDFYRAIEILGPGGLLDRLIEIVRKLPKTAAKELERCAFYFRKHSSHALAIETFIKMSDVKSLLQLYIELQQWDDAFKIAETNPEFNEQIYLPYGHWLAMNDRFEEAQQFYIKAGRADEAIRVLKRLSENAVVQQRFDDAAFYLWTLSKEYLETIPPDLAEDQLSGVQRRALAQFKSCADLAQLYHAYHHIFRFVEDPFTFTLPESLLNMSKFVYLATAHRRAPPGVSRVYTLYTMAKIARNLGGFKLSRFALERLMMMRLPPKWQDAIDLATVTIRGKPHVDSEELQVVCYQCSSVNPPFNPKESACANCGEPFIPSMYSFHNLPLVQFGLEPGISAGEAERLIATDALAVDAGLAGSDLNLAAATPAGDKAAGAGTRIRGSEEALSQQLASLDRKDVNLGATDTYTPVPLARKKLLELSAHDVFVRKWSRRCVVPQYFRRVSPDEAKVAMCRSCQHFFLEDEWVSETFNKLAINILSLEGTQLPLPRAASMLIEILRTTSKTEPVIVDKPVDGTLFAFVLHPGDPVPHDGYGWLDDESAKRFTLENNVELEVFTRTMGFGPGDTMTSIQRFRFRIAAHPDYNLVHYLALPPKMSVLVASRPIRVQPRATLAPPGQRVQYQPVPPHMAQAVKRPAPSHHHAHAQSHQSSRKRTRPSAPVPARHAQQQPVDDDKEISGDELDAGYTRVISLERYKRNHMFMELLFSPHSAQYIVEPKMFPPMDKDELIKLNTTHEAEFAESRAGYLKKIEETRKTAMADWRILDDIRHAKTVRELDAVRDKIERKLGGRLVTSGGCATAVDLSEAHLRAGPALGVADPLAKHEHPLRPATAHA